MEKLFQLTIDPSEAWICISFPDKETLISPRTHVGSEGFEKRELTPRKKRSEIFFIQANQSLFSQYKIFNFLKRPKIENLKTQKIKKKILQYKKNSFSIQQERKKTKKEKKTGEKIPTGLYFYFCIKRVFL